MCLRSSLAKIPVKFQNDVIIITPNLPASKAKIIQYRMLLLTLKHRETHGCVVSIVATDALVLKHQAISIHNAD